MNCWSCEENCFNLLSKLPTIITHSFLNLFQQTKDANCIEKSKEQDDAIISSQNSMVRSHKGKKTGLNVMFKTCFSPKLQKIITSSIFHEIKNRKNLNWPIFRKESNGTRIRFWKSKIKTQQQQNQKNENGVHGFGFFDACMINLKRLYGWATGIITSIIHSYTKQK